MKQDHAGLWERIGAFSLDEPGAEFTFTQRLARENGWDLAYASRVSEEYKKFMLLAVAAGHPVSPSDQVDQAWHLHMTYTRSYWERFCRDILGKPLHHEPTRGGRGEEKKFIGWYQKTLGSYLAFFGQEPPQDIWPAPRARFTEDIRFERVNVKRSVVFPKVAVKVSVALSMAAAGVLLLSLFGGSLAAALGSAMNLAGSEFLGFYLLVFGMVLVGGLIYRWTQRKPTDAPSAEELDLDPYEVAYLAGGEKRSANAAIASLVGRGVLGLLPSEHRIIRVGDLGEDAHPLEGALLRAANVAPGSEVSTLHEAAGHVLSATRSRLESLGLLVSEAREVVPRAVSLVAVLATTIFGLAKVAVGFERHRPVGFLLFLVIASGVAGVAILGRRLGRSRRGDRVIARFRHDYRDLELKAAHAEAGLTSLEIPMAAGLFGLAVLAGGVFEALKDTLKPPSADSGGCGGGCGGGGDGGGGGGGCGGGCGGCGGCGG